MTPGLQDLTNAVLVHKSTMINLPTEDKALISHMGNITLDTGLSLKQALCVSSFNHKLLSV